MENRNNEMEVIPSGHYEIVYRPLVNGEYNKKDDKSIKSSVVGLSSKVLIPVKFAELQSNTNLNMPPANWLSTSKKILGFNPYQSVFSSFEMASTFLNCIGTVDVVSDAENIKKLLKIPYSKGPVSMMVHRIGNTLLLDEFDIHYHLLRTAKEEWAWLKKFYLEHVLEGEMRKSQYRYTRNYLQEKNLAAKFLYHSLQLSETNLQKECDKEHPEYAQMQTIPSGLPGLKPSESSFRDQSVPEFSRNIVWTFEDIQMLLGTNMPIFGGGTHPCISLRLRDMSKPINVLTGLDYWLDNLMCNVPEVVMCYHLGGLVQKYEFIKTEDLPHLPNSQFQPSVVRDVAQNILSFLKSKATKAGHTYWLFKGKGDDIVKLYDLTSLCTDLAEDPSQNPFTTPVAILLFKVANNLWNSRDWKRHQNTVHSLLKNCLAILDKAKYSEIATATYYYLADIYLPAQSRRNMEDDEKESSEDNWEENWEEPDVQEDVTSNPSCDVQTRQNPQQIEPEISKAAQSAITESLEERCYEALRHSIQALECLLEKELKTESAPAEEPTMASPLRPIPMPYKTLNEDLMGQPTDNSNITVKAGTLVTKENLNEPQKQWCRVILEKCALAFVNLAEIYAKENKSKLGNSLKCLRMAAFIWNHLDQNLPSPTVGMNFSLLTPLHSYALGIAGDVYFMLVQQWSTLEEEIHHEDERANEIEVDLRRILDKVKNIENPQVFSFPTSLQQSLELSMECYRMAVVALGSIEQDNRESDYINLAKRLGNVCNEMGVFYMSKASALIEDPSVKEWKHQFVELFQASQKHLEDGILTFSKIKDSPNTALLFSNIGKLYRLQARALAPLQKKEITIAEWKCYTKALQSYEQALKVIENRENHPGIWDAILWEYTSVLFTLASLLQDFAPLSIKSREEIEKEIIRLLETCIEHCNMDSFGARQPLYQYRAATSHYRLASLYHDTYRNGTGESVVSGKNVRLKAEHHYTCSGSIYTLLENWDELIRLQLERVGLYEFQMKHLTGVASKIKVLLAALDSLIETAPAVEAIVQADQEISPKLQECLIHIVTRLQTTLLQLAKLTKYHKKLSTEADRYRQMYSISLRCSTKDCQLNSTISPVLQEISRLRVSQDG